MIMIAMSGIHVQIEAVRSMAGIGSASRRAKIQSCEENEKRNPISQLTYITSKKKEIRVVNAPLGCFTRLERYGFHGLSPRETNLCPDAFGNGRLPTVPRG